MTRAEFIQRLTIALSREEGRQYASAVKQAVLTARALEDSKEAPWDEVSADILHEKLRDIEKSLDCIADSLPHAGMGS